MKKFIYGFFIAVTTLVMGSCRHDSCLDLNCQNGGSCVDDICACPTGYEGPECTENANQKFLGMWVGQSRCEGYPQDPTDTLEIFNFCNPNRILLETGMGNTFATNFKATVKGQAADFDWYEEGLIIVNPYIKVDANSIQLTLVNTMKDKDLRYICEFDGILVPGTDTMEKYNTPRGDCN